MKPINISALRRIICFTALVLMLPLCLASQTAWGQDKSTKVQAAPSLPAGADVGDFIAALSDEQVRRILIDELKKQAASEKPAGSEAGLDGARERFMSRAKFLGKQLKYMLTGFRLLSINIPMTLDNMAKAEGSPGLFVIFLLFIVVVLTATALEYLGRYWTRHSRVRLVETKPETNLKTFIGLGSMLGLELFYALLFLLGYVAAAVVVGNFAEPAGRVAESFLNTFLYFRFFLLIASALVAPGYPHLRLVAVSDEGARYVQRTIIVMVLAGFLVTGITSSLRKYGLDESVGLLLVAVAVINVTIVLIAAIFMAGDRFSLQTAGAESAKLSGLMKGLAAAYLIFLCAMFIVKFLMDGPGIAMLYFGSVGLLPIFLALDSMAKKLCQATFEGPTESEGGKALQTPVQIKSMSKVMHRVIRWVLTISFIMLLAEIWSLTPRLSSALTKPVLTVGFTLFAGYLIWGTTRYYILKRAASEAGGEGGEDDGEHFGAGGSRMDTLLDLFRKFISTLVVCVCLLVILAALGVDIGPLIAGAGVLGLAVGFGAQTLVKDIVAGIFFLIDDAFRVGDYVSAGSTMGTVEAITIRSLKLRHHLGMVHTIPFGSLGSVTNFTRDWIITKIQLRVPFETDLKKVKKIVKKINTMIQENEEMGHNLLAPVKSQGVKKLDDDSAMVVRIKFMAKPGTQFLIKREIYRLVQKLFAKEGIEFAARKVMVQIPANLEGNGGGLSPEMIQAIGAAAIAEEERRKAGEGGGGKKQEALDI